MPTDIETVLVAGASGRTGRAILDRLVDVDVTVRAHTTSSEKRQALRDRGAEAVVVGDLTDPMDAARAVAGVDAVVCTVGISPDPRALFRPLVDGVGVENLVHAAVAAGVELFVLESSLGVGDSRRMLPAPFRLLVLPVLKAKNDAEAELRTSGLTYTIFRPGRLTDAPATGDVLVGEGGATVAGSIPREDVARLMVAALFTPTAHDRTFEVVSRRGKRGKARGLVDVDWTYPGGEVTTVEVLVEGKAAAEEEPGEPTEPESETEEEPTGEEETEE